MAVVFRRRYARRGVEYAAGSVGQDTFVLQELKYIPGRTELYVYINGLMAYPDVDYTLVNDHTIKLASPLPEEAELAFVMRS